MSGSAVARIAVLDDYQQAARTRYIPKASLAGLLLVTAFRLIDFERIRYALRASRYDAGLVLITALSALVIGVEFAILVGVAVSIVLFVPRAAKLKATELFVSPERVVRERLPSDPECTSVAVYDLEGELFFGAALELDRHFETINAQVEAREIRHVVLRLKRARNPDVVCTEKLEHFLRESQSNGRIMLLAGLRPELQAAMINLKFSDWYPPERFFPEEDERYSAMLRAVRYAYSLIADANTCAHCAQHSVELTPVQEDDRLYYLV
jgi:sulfate permease, SulP family